MEQNTSETAYFWEIFSQFASDRFGRAELELSLVRHLLATRTGAALGAAKALGVLPRFEEATNRTIPEMLDGAAVGAIPNGLLLDPANDAGAALLRFLSLHLTVALAEREAVL